MSGKSWKDALLASGQPLEYSASEILARFDLTTPREFGYLRHNENGLQTEFSIDLHASQIGVPSKHDYWVDYLIECKYRRDGTDWVFTPEQHTGEPGEGLKDVFVTLDHLSTSTQFSREFLQKSSTLYRFCTRGCEVIDKEQNTVSIDRAISQLRYAVPNLVADAIEHQVDGLFGAHNPAFLCVPILLTTANLWCLRKDVSIERIRGAEKLADVADSLDILVLRLPPDNLLQKYSTQLLEAHFDKEQKEKIDSLLHGQDLSNFNLYREYLARYTPSCFIVVHLGRFEECIRRLTTFFNHEKTFTANE